MVVNVLLNLSWCFRSLQCYLFIVQLRGYCIKVNHIEGMRESSGGNLQIKRHSTEETEMDNNSCMKMSETPGQCLSWKGGVRWKKRGQKLSLQSVTVLPHTPVNMPALQMHTLVCPISHQAAKQSRSWSVQTALRGTHANVNGEWIISERRGRECPSTQRKRYEWTATKQTAREQEWN